MKSDFICKICNKNCNTCNGIVAHLRTHELSSKDYYVKYLKKENEGICYCGKQSRFISLNKGFSDFCSIKCSTDSQITKNKSKQTCLLHHGSEHPYQSEKIKKIGQSTLLKNYNVSVPCRSLKIQISSKQTCMNKYGVDNYSKTFEFRLLARNRLIERIKKQTDGKINPRIGNNETEFFNELQKQIPHELLLNEYFHGYYPDARIEELKLIIEFDEPEHLSRGWYKNRDIQKDEDYKYLGYRCIRILERNWLNNKNKIISDTTQRIQKMKQYVESINKNKKIKKKKTEDKSKSSVTKRDFGLTESAKIILE